MWFIGVEVVVHPLLKKNPGSAPGFASNKVSELS